MSHTVATEATTDDELSVDNNNNTSLTSTIATTTNNRLPVLADEGYWKIRYARAGLEAAIKNLTSLEAKAKASYEAGTHTRERQLVNEQLHKNLCQHIAQVAHSHARQCYPFEHVDLVFGNVDWCEIPACRSAIRDCSDAVGALHLDSPDVAHPSSNHPPVVALIHHWYSPAFNLSLEEFHWQIWKAELIRQNDIPHTRRALF